MLLRVCLHKVTPFSSWGNVMLKFRFSKPRLKENVFTSNSAVEGNAFMKFRFRTSVPGVIKVGSHVVSVRIHCTEKWRTSFHIDVLSKSK